MRNKNYNILTRKEFLNITPFMLLKYFRELEEYRNIKTICCNKRKKILTYNNKYSDCHKCIKDKKNNIMLNNSDYVDLYIEFKSCDNKYTVERNPENISYSDYNCHILQSHKCYHYYNKIERINKCENNNCFYIKNKSILKICNKMLVQHRKNARLKNKSFNLELKDIMDRYISIDSCCELSGIKFEFESNYKRNPLRPSIDRIDNNIGYEKNNIRIVCVWINNALNEWGEILLEKMSRKYINKIENNKKDVNKNEISN